MALGFVALFAEAFADAFVSGVDNGVIRAPFANGDAVAALRFSGASGIDEAADEP